MTLLSDSKLATSIVLDKDREEAIPLITFDTNSKKFLINEQAEAILKKLVIKVYRDNIL